jgi:beta-galactosidase
VSDADAARIRSLPYFLCEYAHAMGTGPGGIRGYIDAFGHTRHAGGCVWEWRDHALDRRLPDGRLALGYGGDFGEDVHDGNFVCDGLVSADSVPSAGLVAWANAVAPVVAVPDASGAITVTSDLRLATVSGLVVSWYARSGWSEARGEVEIVDIAPGASLTVRPELPAGFGGALDVMTAWVLDPGTPGIAARSPRAVDLRGRDLPPNVGEADESDRRVAGVRQWVGPRPALQVRDRTASPSIGTGASSVEAAEDLVRQLRPVLFRGPTDNDRGGQPSDARSWADARLPLLEHRVVDAADGRLVLASGVPSRQRRLTTTLTWMAGPQGMDVSAAFEFAGDWPNLPRIGLTVPLPAESWDGAQVAWAGLGPTENYSDLADGVFLGTFAGGIDELWTPRIRPQEAGHRGLVTDLALEGRSRLDVRADAPGFGFSLCRWTPRQLDAATHPEELPPSDTWWLTIDAAHAGIGTASCGPATDPRFAVQPTARVLVFSLSHRRG